MPRVDTLEAQSALILPFPGDAVHRSGAREQRAAQALSQGAIATERLPPGQAVLLIVAVSGALWAGIAASVIWMVG